MDEQWHSCMDMICDHLERGSIIEAGKDTLRWALFSVISRAFVMNSKKGPVVTMVPYLDLSNHWTPTRQDDRSCPCVFDETANSALLVAQRTILHGQEMTHSYCEASDSAMLCQYGIAPMAPGRNRFNRAQVCVPLEAVREDSVVEPLRPFGAWTNSALLSARMHALQLHGWRDQSRPLTFTVPEDLGGRGPLLAVASLLAMDTLQDVERWRVSPLQTSGKNLHPLVEGRAWRLIVGWLEEAHSSAVRATEELVQQSGNSRNSAEATRIRLALTTAAAGEVLVLEEALSSAEQRATLCDVRAAGG